MAPSAVSTILVGINAVMTTINVVTNLGRDNQKLYGEIRGSLQKLLHAVTLTHWDSVKYEGVDEDLSMLMHELLDDIDDFISQLSDPEKISEIFKSAMMGACAADTRPAEVEVINAFLETIKTIEDWQKKMEDRQKDKASASTDLPVATAPYAPEKDLDGLDTRKLLELLSPVLDGQLRLISIVGCNGLGKTCLAMALYKGTRLQQTCEESPYNCKAWVDASMCNDVEDLISEIIKKVGPMAAGKKTFDSVKNFLMDKRYLIIMDDLRSRCIQWKDVEHIFPKNNKDSRIIVTTNVLSIAMDYSSGSYYVHPMQCLCEAKSAELFWKKVLGSNSEIHTDPEVDRSKDILAKCDGLPIAIVAAGNFCSKSKEGFLGEEVCEEVSTELGSILASDETAFRDLKTMFIRCYNRLKDHDQKICMLYLSIYPRGLQVNTKDFARRLSAEALVAEQDTKRCLKELSDQSMISSTNKSFKIQGMMLEFATQKSLSRNLVTLVEDGNVRPKKPEKTVPRQLKPQSRRLSIHCATRTSSSLIPEEVGVSTVRSLIIFKNNHPSAQTRVDVVDFKAFKVMRVLDLEGCKGLTNSGGVLDTICELLLLKHLNLKSTDVDQIPTKIEKLNHLEMLDIRHTQVATLPLEVIMLPQLAHLFGEFVLPALRGSKKTAVTTFLKEKSKLHTLNGIIIKKSSGFDVVIRHARKLKMVKICDSTNTAQTTSAPKSLLRSLMCFSGGSVEEDTHDGIQFRRAVGALVNTLQERCNDLDSVSIGSGLISRSFLDSSMDGSTLRYMKLRGPLTSVSAAQLHPLHHLRKLYLFSTGLSSKDLVEALQNLKWLESLKLGENDLPRSWSGEFSVPKDAFPALRDLSFKGAKKFPRVEIEEGGMRVLASLKLLCPFPMAVEAPEFPVSLMRVEGIEHLKYLDVVILHYTADDATIKAWESTARGHSNMPCVKKQGKPAQPTINSAA